VVTSAPNVASSARTQAQTNEASVAIVLGFQIYRATITDDEILQQENKSEKLHH
jgi:hypothetical protein